MRNKILNSCNKIVDDKKDKVVDVILIGLTLCVFLSTYLVFLDVKQKRIRQENYKKRKFIYIQKLNNLSYYATLFFE